MLARVSTEQKDSSQIENLFGTMSKIFKNPKKDNI
tara:strand:+ start:994 stop:1098 length:105 start_codon:yes stop_codon:yes gene_type:complete